MRLSPDTTLGSYTILSLLGKGGMGEVWRARDTKLDRDVAIKVLPEQLASDTERVLRFEREAKLLASLNHTNIGAIHGLEESDGKKFLVLEYVEGETLGARIKRGALPVDEALETCQQIAEALEAAHEKGVIHRDLKPGNVMVRPDGTVKVLDFGLARAMADDSGSSSIAAESPTITADYTKPGVVLGTAPYMSPEQARGRPLDKRTDIWSFGVILYECLTGKRLFHGETATDSMGAIMHRDPDWTALPLDTPPTIRLLLRRCLAKDRKKRLHDIADARVELEEAIADPANSALALTGAVTDVPTRTSRALLSLAPLVVLVVAVFAALTAWQLKPQPEPPRAVLRKLQIVVDGVGHDEVLSPVISPDGTRVMYVAKGSLWVRSLGDLEAIELTGTEGARSQFWSPDSAQVGFFDDSRLWRMPAAGGARIMICVAPRGLWGAGGVAWTADDRIVFTTAWGGPFWGVPVGGGEPRAMFRPDPERVRDFHHASELPDGSGVLSVLHRATGEADTIVVVRSDSFKEILEDPHTELGSPLYANGHIVYERNQMTGTIWAAPFSLATQEVTGPPFLLANSAESPSVSSDGTLVYAPSSYIGTGQLVWVDRTGAVTEVIGQPQPGLREPHVSPDDARVAAYATESGANQIWIHELARGTRRPFSGSKGTMWISDWMSNDLLAYTTDTKTYLRSVTTADPAELLVDGDRDYTTVVSFDRRYAAIERRVGKSLDIYYFDVQAGSGALPLLVSDDTEVQPAIRPGSGWIAYVSDETGREEVYIAKFPSGAGKQQVSVDGGTTPLWSRKGDELFFQSGRGRTDYLDIMFVSVTTEPQLQLTESQRLFGGADANINVSRGWSVSSDGQRILGVRAVTPESDTRRITVVENWYREFEKP